MSESIDGFSALVARDINVAVFYPVFFIFNKSRNRVNILYWERNSLRLPRRRNSSGHR